MPEPADPRAEAFAALEARVRLLEREVAELRAAPAVGRVASFRTAPVPPPPPPPQATDATGAPLHPPPPPLGAPFAWADGPATPRRTFAGTLDSETVLKWGGIALVVLAVGFAVSTAISRGWIGPELQLAGALTLATALIVTGLRVRAHRRPWTHALCSGGVAALFVIVASDLFLEQVDAGVARGLTVAVAVAALALARYIPSEWVGGVTLAGAIASWLVISDGDPSYRPTLGWFGLLAAAVVALSIERRWAVLRIAGQLAGLVIVLSFAAEAADAGDRVLLLAAAAVFSALLLVVPSRPTTRPEWQPLEVALATVLGPWALAVLSVTFDIDEQHRAGALAFAVAAGVVGATLVVRRRSIVPHVVALLLGASVTCSIGLTLLLGADETALALAVQGAGLIELGRRMGRRVLLLLDGAVLCAGSALFVLGRMTDAWVNDVPFGHDVSHLATMVAALAGAWLFRERLLRRAAAAAFLAMLLVWVGSVLVHLPQGQAVVSAVWAAIGVAVLIVGATRKQPDVAAAGLAVLGVTVAKLLTVDLRAVDTLWRAGLFLLVGFALLRLGFLLPRLTAHGDATTPPGPPPPP